VHLAFERSSPPTSFPKERENSRMKALNLRAVRARQTTFMFHEIDLVVLFRNLLAGIFGKPLFPS
jgi:hypothetical protein